MSALLKILRVAEGNGLTFWCPGCDTVHVINHGGNGWAWNGNAEKPTFSPSVLVTSGHYSPGERGACWCTYNAEHPDAPAPFKCQRCHSFVRDGQIQFLTDSTHHLAGQTVPLADWPTSAATPGGRDE